MRITLDAGSSLPFDTVYMGYHNGYSTGTYVVSADDTSGNLYTTPSYASAAQPLRYAYTDEFTSWQSWHEVESTQTYRYVGIEITDDDNPDGFFNCGIIYVGNRYKPGMQSDLGSDWHYDDTSIITEMANGETVTRRRRRVLMGSESWSKLSAYDAEWFKSLSRTYGMSTPVVIKSTPHQAQYGQANLAFVRMTSYRGPELSAPYGHNSQDPNDLILGPRYDVSVAFREV
jgi:hypothetical protein